MIPECGEGNVRKIGKNSNHAYYVAFFLCFICAIGFLTTSSAADLAFDPVLSVEPSQGVISAGGTASVHIVADSFYYGLSGYTLIISSSDPAVLTIGSATFPSWAALFDQTVLSDGSLMIKAIDLNDVITPGTGKTTLADLTITGVRNGKAEVSISVKALDDDIGGTYHAQVRFGTMIVGTGPTPTLTPVPTTPTPTWTPMPPLPTATPAPATPTPTIAPTWTWTPVPTWTPAPTIAPVPSAQIALYSGWNFVSIPAHLAQGANTAMIFSHVSTEGHSIWSYDTLHSKWNELAADSQLEPMQGYWIYSSNNRLVPLIYDQYMTGISKNLYEGWNAFGLFGATPVPASIALSAVHREWTTALGYSAPYQIWESAIVNGGHGQFSDSRELIPMRGYWLFMSTDGKIDIIA